MESDLTQVVVYLAADCSICCRLREVFFEQVDVGGVLVQCFGEVN